MDLVSALYQLAVLASWRPSPQELARALAVHILQLFDTRYVRMLVLDEGGHWHEAASFGEHGEHGEHGELRCGCRGPGEATCPSLSGYRPQACRFPRSASVGRDHVVCLPLILRGRLVGSCQFTMAVDPQLPRLEDFWETIAIGCAVLLVGPPVSTDSKAPRPALSPRQEQILALVAEGLTNLQIGNRLGYSESTIGHDLVGAYERLGVRNRQDAVRALPSLR